MKNVLTDTSEQISLLEEGFNTLTSRIRVLQNDKVSMQCEILELQQKVESLKNDVRNLEEKSKMAESRRAAAETVLKAAKSNYDVCLNENEGLEYVFLDN